MAFLIVEDDPLLADVLRTAVAGLELRPVVAATLGEADLVLETVRVDGLALDLHLGDGDPVAWLEGLQLLFPPLVERAVVLADPDVDADRAGRVRRTGAGLLRRPFTTQDFERAFAVQLGVEDEPSDEPVPPLRPQRRRPERFDS
jgi:response regulator of citrate/malate metabolism